MFDGADEQLDTLMAESAMDAIGPSHQIMRVAPENVTPLWPQVQPLIESVVKQVPTHTCEDVRLMLMNMRAHLWIQWDGQQVEAVFVTEFVPYPQGVWLRFWIVAARKDHKLDQEAFVDTLRAFGIANGCRGFEWCGRVGWMRARPYAKLEGVVMREAFHVQ